MNYAAGIGIGSAGNTGSITITGGNVSADGTSTSRAIGDGVGGGNITMLISGGSINAYNYNAIGSPEGTLTLTWTQESRETMRVYSNGYVGKIILERDFLSRFNNCTAIHLLPGELSNSIIESWLVTHELKPYYGDGFTVTFEPGEAEGAVITLSSDDEANWADSATPGKFNHNTNWFPSFTMPAADLFPAPAGKLFIGWKRADNDKLYEAEESLDIGTYTLVAQWGPAHTITWVEVPEHAEWVDAIEQAATGSTVHMKLKVDLTGHNNRMRMSDFIITGEGIEPIVTEAWLTSTGPDDLYHEDFIMPDTDVSVTPKWEYRTVTFDSNGGSAVEPLTVISGTRIEKPEDPTRDGYVFGGWARSEQDDDLFDFDTDYVIWDITLTAVWEEVQEPVFKGHAILLTGQIGLQFFLELPAGKTAADYPDSYVTFDGNKINSATQHALPASTAVINGQDIGRYEFVVNMTSSQMADKFTPTFHYTEGEEEKTVVGEAFSAQDYIDWALTAVTGKDLVIVKALADYGYYAQPYLSAQNGWTIGTGYAAMTTHVTESFDYDAVMDAAQEYAIVKGTNENITKVIVNDINKFT